MDFQLIKYRITPRVVPVGVPFEISVEGLDRSAKFYDDCEYLVTVIRTDGFKYAEGKELNAYGRTLTTDYNVSPKKGVITFSHTYDIEGEWGIKITRVDETDKHVPEHFLTHFPAGKKRMFAGVAFKIYALEKDLYVLRPYKGDLHIHSFESDGFESPELVAANYRKKGYDFISLTDHYRMDTSFALAEKFKSVNGGLKVFPGEEVHPLKAGGVFHVVNFNGKKSVNEIYDNDEEKAIAEIEEIAKEFNLEDKTDAKELGYFKWIFNKIREVGGIAIYPHAFWQVGYAYHVRPHISDRILRDKMCDAYEVFGGMSRRDNREMLEYSAKLRAEGVNLPVVASSDAHSSFCHGNVHFDDFWTLCFAEDKDSIPSNIVKGNTVAIDNLDLSDITAHGELRLVRYAYFLLEQYYFMHDDLCGAIGQALTRFVFGEKEQKKLVDKLNLELEKFDDCFFGK
ncbi:MAG: PHP domain-containing protein [Clostridia bacterium]|nr:PHP domain-containing protein [Clostridia bacterium]